MKAFITLFLLLLTCLSSHAAKIKGEVKDGNGQPLVGATIVIDSLANYTTSGMDGTFILNKIPQGRYEMRISFVGYKTQLLPVTIKQENQTVKIEVVLNENVTALHEVTINGQASENSVAKAITRERKAENIINAISGQTIQLSPDISVSDVLQRVSGVSLEKQNDGSGSAYAIIRGMPKRYNYTLINGIKIPSPNNKNRYISMDIFPSDLLDRLEVSKTLTPSKEADAVGGVVNMVMKSAPYKFLFTMDFSVGYHDIFFRNPFYYVQTKFINPVSIFEQKGVSYFAKPEDFTSRNIDIQTRRFVPDIRGNITVGNRFLHKRLGMIFSVSYNHYTSGTDVLRFTPTTRRDGTSLPVLSNMSQRFYYNDNTRSGVYFMSDFHLNKKNYFQFFTTYLNLNNNQVRRETIYRLWGVNPDNLNVKTYNDRFRKTSQQIYNATLKGNHVFGEKSHLDWALVYSKASQQRPDNAEFVSISNYSLVAGQESVMVAEDGDNFRRWEHNDDHDMEGVLNFNQKIFIGGLKGLLKTGLFYRNKTRNSFIVTYRFNPHPANQGYGYDWKPDDPNVKNFSSWEKYSDITWDVQNPQGTTTDELNYDAYERVGATYIQLNLSYHRWKIIAGARVRQAEQGYTLLAPRMGESPLSNHVYRDVLPSLHVKYNLGETGDIKASWFYSVVMPGYFEIVPYTYAGEDYTELGSPDLKPIHAHNFDIRYGNYFNVRNYYSIGVFYKIIYDPIEYTLVNGIPFGITNIVRKPDNFGKAINYGLELDYTRYFRNIGIKVNYTYTKSSITTPKTLRVREDPQDPASNIVVKTVNQTRPLQGQADNIGNASLLYKGLKNGINTQLSVVYTGYRIRNVSNFYNNDEWQSPYWTVDFAFDKKIKNGWKVYLKIKNIFDNEYKVIIRQPLDESNAAYPNQGEPGSYFLTQKDLYGRSFRLGVQYKF